MQAQTSFLQVAGQQIPISEWNPGAGPTILFLHGFGRPPHHYDFLRRLAVDQGFRVIAPFLYPNNSLDEPPRSFRACVALTRAVVRELGKSGRLNDGYTVLGHSTGASVAQCLANVSPTPSGILALDPVMPVSYGPFGFLWRAAKIGVNQLLGRSGPALRAWQVHAKFGANQLANLIRRPEISWALARDLSELQLQEFRLLYDASGSRGVRFDVPCTVLQAQADEFFRIPHDLRAWMGLVFENFDVRELREVRGHEWPIMEPELAAQKVAAWIVGKSRAPGVAQLAQLTA